jgi:fibronectin-binding autotransporter adhesin
MIKIKLQSALVVCVLGLMSQVIQGQTSWKGTTSTNWSTATNWTAGVPTSTIDATIGDSCFTGAFQPLLTATSNCKNLTIGAGIKASTLTIAQSINVYGNMVIGSNGTILANTSSRTITLKGNWVNSGTYTATKTTAKLTFSGTAQSLTGVTAFQSLTINSGCILTLSSNISIATIISISGTLDPTASYTVSGSGTMSVASSGTIKVHTATFAGNYTISGTVTLNGTSTVNYASASIPQDISSSYTYGYLRISGGSTKSLTANLPVLSSASTSSGRIYIDAGTLDLGAYTANRNTSTSGGSITLAANTQLRIGGSNGFPANYLTKSIASTSTVEYYGDNQTVIAVTYGHLIFSGTSGSITKTMPATAFTIAGNFTCNLGTATAVSFTAAQNITVNLNVTIGTGCTFNAATFSHAFKANWINNGTFTGSTSTVTLSGVSSSLSGSGTNNFNNITFSAFGINAGSGTALSVSGNMVTSGSGAFTHGSGGTVSMTGTTKTISGNGFVFSNLVISGSVTTAANMRIDKDITINGTFSASAGTITMSGVPGVINGSASPTFYSLSITGTTTTANSFSMLANLSVATTASFTASAGTATMNGTSTLSGIVNLNNVTIIAAKTLTLGNSSVLGISGTFTKTGTLNVTSATPNTVKYNGAGAQSIIGGSYYNLVLAGGGTKTPAAALTVNNDFTINSGVTFNASSFIFSLYRHLNNYGTFVSGTSDVQLRGVNAATLTGTTTFNKLTINKSTSVVRVTLASNITAVNIAMTLGNILTDTFSITATGRRTGNGIIIGTVIHSHAFASDTAYAFEGPNNLITFKNPSGISSVTVTSKIGEIPDFDHSIECVIREYGISISSGTYTHAKLKLHYENNELNAFSEPFLAVYRHNNGIIWDSLGFSSRDTGINFVEKDSITSLPGRYTASGTRNIVRWNGSVSSAWDDAANWTTISGASMSNRVPTSTDAAQIGVGTFVNQPVIATTQQVSVLRFGSSQSATLTINGGTLNTFGSIRGIWSNSRSHTLDVSSGTLTSGTTLSLSDDTTGHDIHLKIGSGTVNVSSDLNQSATGAITFTGSGSLKISGDYEYTSGPFNAGTGTVYYSGGEAQEVAHLIYNNLSFTKSTERANFRLPTRVIGNLSISTGGELDIYDTLSIGGNLVIGSSTYLYNENAYIKVGGNWVNNGIYVSDNGTEYFNGTGSQTVNASTFSNLVVNKTSGTLLLTNNIVINNTLSVMAGTLDLDSLQANRFTEGGVLTVNAGATLKMRGANNFPTNYITNTLAAASNINYYGTTAQNISSLITYGNLVLSNGGTSAKSLIGNIQVNGDFTINAGATFSPGVNSVNLYGNFINSGTYTPGTSTMLLNGVSKTITGSTTFNDLSVVAGSYTVSSGTTSVTGDLYVESTGSLNFGSNTVILDGDLTNKGTLVSSGTATFTGTRVQTFQLLNALTSSSTGIVNFNGTVSPVVNSTSAPTFATLNINNTAGVTPSVPWSVFVAFNVASGAIFDGGPLTHTFYGNFTNNGTVLSSGKLKFTPGAPFSASATITLDGVSFNSTGEVEFAGTGPITILQNSPILNVVNITNSHSSGITAPGSWLIADELRISSSSIFNAGTSTHVISGTMLNNGMLNGQTSTISFDGSQAEINGLGTYNFNNLKIASTGNLTLNRSVNILKNFILDGVFNGDGRTVNFTGTTASAISGSAGSVTFGDVEQSKTGVVTTLSIPATVTGNLELTSGVIVTTTTNILIIADDATASSGNASSFVSGPMKKVGNDAFEFPLGKNNFWARLGITAPSVVTDAFVAEYFNNPYANTTTMAGSPSPVLNDVSVFEYWICDRVTGTSNVKVKLFWETGYSGIDNYSSDLVVARWNGSAWENKGQSAITASRPGSVTSNTVTSFSPFTFGSLSSLINMLPIKLLEFKGKLNEKKEVVLEWKTASEKNNDYFTVERSSDGVTFEPLLTIDGADNSQSVLSYMAKDPHPYKGVSYYKLKQTDLNGHSEYSQIIVIVNNDLNALELYAYPNPVSDIINLDLNPGKEGNIIIRDVLGNIVYTQTTGKTKISIDVSEYAAGIYIITLETGNGISQVLFKKI